jgi:integrase
MKKAFKKTRYQNIFLNESGNFVFRGRINGKDFRRVLNATGIQSAKKEADLLVSRLRGQTVRTGKDIRGMTWAEEVADWLRTVEENRGLSKKTKVKKRWASNFFREAFGKKRIDQITREDVERWWIRMGETKKTIIQHFVGGVAVDNPKAEPFSNTSMNIVLMCLSEVFERRVGVTIEINPCKYIKFLRQNQKKPIMPSEETFRQIVEEMKRCKLDIQCSIDMVEFLAFSGMRIGEARGLRWEDIGEDRILINGVKATGYRTIPIFPKLKTVIERLRTYWDGKTPHGKVFLTSFPERGFHSACDRLGIPRMRIHDLRHLFATTAMERGVPVGTIALWLGHKDGGALLMRTYSHVRIDASWAQAQLLA